MDRRISIYYNNFIKNKEGTRSINKVYVCVYICRDVLGKSHPHDFKYIYIYIYILVLISKNLKSEDRNCLTVFLIFTANGKR